MRIISCEYGGREIEYLRFLYIHLKSSTIPLHLRRSRRRLFLSIQHNLHRTHAQHTALTQCI